MMFRSSPRPSQVLFLSTSLLLAWWLVGPAALAQQGAGIAADAQADEPDLPAEETPDPAAARPRAAEAQPPGRTATAPARPDIGTKPYLVLQVDEDQRRERFNVMAMLRNRKFEPGEEERFEAYYRRYFLPRWTQPANRASLPLLRRELRNNLLSGRTGPPHKRLQAVILDYLGKMASANVHPAARVNAMLMIGELNAEEPLRAGDTPTPLPAALPVLLQALGDDEQIDPVKVAALVGIIRYTQFGQLTPEATSAVQQAMIRLTQSPGAPARSPEGHAWMRAQAAKALGLLGSVGRNAEVPRLLTNLVADRQLDMLVRCRAATALGQLNYTGADGLSAAQPIAALGRLAADAIRADTDHFDEDPNGFSRRRVKARLVAVLQGLAGDEDEPSQGIAPLVGAADEKATYDSLREQIEKLSALFDDRQSGDAEIVQALRASLAGLEPARSPATAQTGQ